MFFKYWNVVRYFYPNNYILDIPWDTTLINYIIPISNASDAQSLYLLYMKIATALNDSHVFGWTYSDYYQALPGFYQPSIRLKYIDSQYVVIKSLVSGVHPGDAIISIDGLTTRQWEDSLKPYYSSGNMSAFRSTMCYHMLGRIGYHTHEAVSIEDSTGSINNVTLVCVNPNNNTSFFYDYIYPADSLDSVSWTTLQCDIGYVNIGNITDAGADSAYNVFYNYPAIIVDIRNYPIVNSGFDLAYRMFSSNREFAMLTLPDITYPGTYYWQQEYEGNNGNTTPYTGQVIILMNEITESAAEYDCMVLSANSNAIKVGSQTVGADGNVTTWRLSQDIHFGFSTLGIFYPNGDSTQRIGIVPDSVVYPTRTGIYHHNDEVLDKALEIAGCNLYTKNTKLLPATIQVFPNPATTELTISASVNITSIVITNIIGQTEYSNQYNTTHVSINVSALPTGMYLVRINGSEVRKFVKE